MLFALLALALIALVLAAPLILDAVKDRRRRRAADRADDRGPLELGLYDPGRERRAEQRARELLRSCVNGEEWAMYRDLGFIRVGGKHTRREADKTRERAAPASIRKPGERAVPASIRETRERAAYAYLVYPHKPIVAFVPETGQLLSEYCVEFPDFGGAGGRHRLPASDDVLAKWMALTSDEDRVIRRANMHLIGRQHDPARIRRDLWRLGEWERRRGPRSELEQHQG